MKLNSLAALAVAVGLASNLHASDPKIDNFVRDFYAAYKAKDAARMAQFYTDDATFSDPSFELVLKGPGQIHDLFEKVFPKYESLDFEIAQTTSAGNDLIVEGGMIGKIADKMVRVPFVSVFHFRGNKIAMQRDLFDVAHFLVQLGAIPPPFAPKPTPSPSPRSDQAAATTELKETIARMDTKIFDAFNAHNVDLLMSMFTDDLEFYQDNDGLKNYRQSKDDFTKLFGNVPDIKRNLVKDSLEVYPVKDYGAIEIGAHRFCHKENGKDDCGTFKFAMIWRKTGDTWKISRVLSYGHN
jgi:ketosteroid isomerase-like protein